MALCRGRGRTTAVILSVGADPCPWRSITQDCVHVTHVENVRPSSIHNVEIFSKSVYQLTNFGGTRVDVIKYYPLISSQGIKFDGDVITPLLGNRGKTEQLFTQVTFHDATQYTATGWVGQKENFNAEYELDIP